MKESKQRRRFGIRWKLLACFGIFASVTIILLWLCQNVFLSDIYKRIKIREIKTAYSRIESSIDNGTFAENAEKIANEYNVCIIVLAESGTFDTVSVDAAPYCIIHHTNITGLMKIYYQARDRDDGIVYYARLKDSPNVYQSDVNDRDSEQSIVLSGVHATDSDNAIIFLNSVISPVSATVNTLNTILIYITFALIILSFILAFVLSQVISKPIVSLTRSARRLAQGDYDAVFMGGGYSEADTLAATLNYAEGELSKVDKLQKELVANISHDLRTPLTMISGYSEMMRDIPSENTQENLQVIIDETERLTSLVNDVLDISKLQSGAQVFEKKRMCITDTVERAMTRYAKLVSGGYDISYNHGEEKHYIIGDETRVLQVIYNLVNNAVTYTGEDKRVIVSEKENDGYIRISVTDTGEGIAEDKLPLIWERYYKVDALHKRSAMGTGLGLSIVRGIMSEHGGRYGVESTLGSGSTFWVEFPISRE